MRSFDLEVSGSVDKNGRLDPTHWFTFGDLGTRACWEYEVKGPDLSAATAGWPRAGLRIRALKNTTLTSFVVNNVARGNTVYLTTPDGQTVYHLGVFSRGRAYTAMPNWQLVAGHSYDLILEGGGQTGRMVRGLFPQSSPDLSIDGGVDQKHRLSRKYWFTFAQLTTASY